MKRLIASVSTVTVALLASSAFAAVGRTAGSFAVSPVGAATYSIPIWVPPGPRGVQPKLAISYSSHGGGGTLGPGWAVSGLSAITRCPRTVAQDGAPAGISLTYNDAFCLDGKRLRLYGATAYGQPGSQYQTEIADFSLVTANGTQGNGPASFTVQGKDGRTYEYGTGGNAQVIASGTATAVTWMLNKVIDRSNNRMIITYLAPNANLASATVPDQIDWTAVSAGSGTFNYHVKFNYVGNNPQGSTIGYVASAPILNAELLANIVISSGATAEKKYVFSYELSPVTSSYRLAQVKECADAGEADCLAPTVITWQNGQSGVATSASGTSSTIPLNDANGDGFPDLFYVSGGAWYVAFGSASGFGSGVPTGAPSGSGAAVGVVGDVLGNGHVGILANVGNYWSYYWWNGSGFTSAPTGVPVDTSANSFVLTDGTGDGRADLFSMTFASGAGHLYMRPSTGSGASPTFGAPQNPYNSSGGLDSASIGQPLTSLPFVDLNGDGRHDLLMYSSSVYTCQYIPPYPYPVCAEFYAIIALVSQADGTYIERPVGGQVGANPAALPDFVNWNNDACTDIIYTSGVSVSKCNGSDATSIPVSNAVGALDWDGDGRADVVVVNGANLGVRLSTGSDVSSTIIDTGIPYSSSTCAQVYALDVDGDGLDDLGCFGSSLTYYIHNSPNSLPNLVTSISDGYGVVVSPSYVSLSHGVASGVFDPTPDASYPYRDYNGPFYVVGSFTGTDGTGLIDGSHNFSVQYRYSRAWADGTGRGFSGFDSMRVIDSRNSLQNYQYYWRDFPYAGMLRESHVFQPNGKDISQSVSTRNAKLLDTTLHNERSWPYAATVTRNEWEVGAAKDGLQIATASTVYDFDNYGNVTTLTETITDKDLGSPYLNQSWTSTVSTTVTPDTGGNWCLDLPTAISVQRTAPGVSGTVTRSKSFIPDYAKCRHTQQTTASGAYEVIEDLAYDAFGNLNSLSTTGHAMTPRVMTLNWGTTGQFPTSVTNALNHSTQYGYDFDRGLRTSTTDANGIQTTWSYDTFGRRILEHRPDGTETSWSYAGCGSGCVNSGNVAMVTTNVRNQDGSIATDAYTYLDRYGRTLVTRSRLLSGGYEATETQYDALGRVSAQTVPCDWTSCTKYWTSIQHDSLGRLTRIQQPVNEGNSGTLKTVTFDYLGVDTVVTDELNMQRTRTMSVVGTLLRSKDNNGYYQNFAYDGFGSLLSVTDSLSHTLFEATYDYGREAFQRTTYDRDLGSRTRNYDALGELISYTDNNGHSFGISYDALARPVSRSEPDLTTTYSWGTNAANHSIGRLEAVTAGSYGESFTYDDKGRTLTHTISVPSEGNFTYTTAYNSITGLSDTLTYPTAGPGTPLKLQYGYQNGILHTVSDFNSGTVYWTANATNASGQLTQQILGNGVVTNRAFDAVTGWLTSITSGVSGGAALQNEGYLYDSVGNVTQRQNNNVGLTESFFYDNLYRLDHSTLGGNVNLALTYDPTGNITSRSDVAGGAAWTYGSSQPHAVTQAGNSAYNYSYDGNGNLISRSGNSISWTSFDHPLQINGPGGEWIQFAYTHDHVRWKAVHSGSGGIDTTYFIGGLLEEVATAGGREYRHTIKAGGTPVAVFSRTDTGVTNLHYILTDNLGGVAALLDDHGNSYVKESFGAFGARRNQCTWSGPPTQGTKDKIAAVTPHGYTWHAALADMGLNDMNGRIQDATTGRFLSPDPMVVSAANTQAFNRYSYVLNNPMTLVDPSGLEVDGGDDMWRLCSEYRIACPPGQMPNWEECSGVQHGCTFGPPGGPWAPPQDSPNGAPNNGGGGGGSATPPTPPTGPPNTPPPPPPPPPKANFSVDMQSLTTGKVPVMLEEDITGEPVYMYVPPDEEADAAKRIADAKMHGLERGLEVLADFVVLQWAGEVGELLDTLESSLEGAEVESAAVDAAKTENAVADVRYGPMNPGPLPEKVAETFRSSSYTARTLTEETTLYRVYGGKSGQMGPYWSRTPPSGPLQSVIDSALDQNWGNNATQVAKIQVPAGTIIYEGAAAAQRGLVGGGDQVYIPNVNPAWVVQ